MTTNAASILANGIHATARFIADGEVRDGNKANGYGYREWLVARGRCDSQESRRDWRGGK